MKPKTKLPERRTIRVAMKDGTVIAIPDLTFAFQWNATSKSFVEVLPFETQKRINDVFKKGGL